MVSTGNALFVVTIVHHYSFNARELTMERKPLNKTVYFD
jgi:hypothetical protein